MKAEHYFDRYLDTMTADVISPLVRPWRSGYGQTKSSAIANFQTLLNNPEKIRQALSRFSPFERNVLALLKRLAGECDVEVFIKALLATGILPPSRTPLSYNDYGIHKQLLPTGLFLYLNDNGTASTDYHYQRRLFTDPRILDCVDWPLQVAATVPFTPTLPPSKCRSRTPQNVVLDLINFMQTVENNGGFGCTQKGTPRIADIRAVAGHLGWDGEKNDFDNLPFRKTAEAFTYALLHSPWIKLEKERYQLAISPHAFAELSIVDQVTEWLYAFTQAVEWDEIPRQTSYQDGRTDLIRLVIVLLLSSFPPNHEFIAVEELENRLNEIVKRRPLYINGVSWFQQTLTTWLYTLGIVELGLENGLVISLRLTELGKSALQNTPPPKLSPATEEHFAWIVQPNLEVLVYLDHITPAQLTFITGHTRHLATQEHTARYQIEHQSIYRALEKGSAVDAIIAQLAAQSGAPLPQNVVVEIQQWAARREKITLHLNIRLLEFPDAAQRNAALAAGTQGRPLGEKFILLFPEATVPPAGERIDYAQKPRPILTAEENGKITQLSTTANLFLLETLRQWCTELPFYSWQLSEQSVKKALAAHGSINTLLAQLTPYLTQPLPHLLGLALRNWAGAKTEVNLEAAIILRCPNAEIYLALAGSRLLRPAILGNVPPNILLIRTDSLDWFKEQLKQLGIRFPE